METITQWAPGTKVKTTQDYLPPDGGIGLIKDKIYIVHRHLPRWPYPEFRDEKERYQFFCGQIIPKCYSVGTVWLVCGDFFIACNDSVLEEVGPDEDLLA